MSVTATTVDIARGVSMPFLPMNPRVGAPLRSKIEIKKAVQSLEDESLVIHPSLRGTRACLAVVDCNVFIQDQEGHWITEAPRNGHDFLKLPNNTCLDGYIAYDNFYPADCLAVRGQTLLYKAALEREAVAFQLTKFLGHEWLFRRPSCKFIRAAAKNLPDYPGLVLKDYMSFYAMLSSSNQTSKEWLRRPW